MNKIKTILTFTMFVLIALGIIAASLLPLGCSRSLDPNFEAQKSSYKASADAQQSVPIPKVSYFQERRTIAKWTERWDKPSVVTYVYLVSFGNILGYYVADGKPSSTRSYLTPESTYQKMTSLDIGPTIHTMAQAPDIDGTYGDNNPGIRFFTADGVAVEWGGSGASYLYTDAPLPIDVPKLNRAQ